MGDMIMTKQRRKTSRTDLWFASEAIVTYENWIIKGFVNNLGARGMFLETLQKIPVDTDVEVEIIFQSKNPSKLSNIKGTVSWCGDKGIGIRFTEIDLELLRECMTSMMEG